ncbi:WD40 repeat domain-containing protein [Vairimorpha necatrix]|uniref:WD40 repeat domain-containing protein n=1 Tax=Vairimorpha necatrix TaxID=6039 RepID=A0AAX4JCJ7_9MICR
MTISRIQKNTKISDMTNIGKIIICNKSTHLEFYDTKLSFLSSLSLDFYTYKLVKYSENILILIGKNKYQICNFEYSINKKVYNLKKINLENVNIKYYEKYHVWSNLVIFYSDEGLKMYHFTKDRLLEDDVPNDLDFFTLLHYDFCGNILNIVARDVEDTTYILRYNNKFSLTKKIKKSCMAIYAFNQGYILINEGLVWYEINNKKVAETEFGNTKITSSVIYEGNLILSMKDNELIKISVENENMIIVKVFELNTFNNLVLVDNLILGHTTCGYCQIFNIKNDEIEIIQSLDSISNLNRSIYNDKRLYFYNDKFMSMLSNFQMCKTVNITDCTNLQSFYFFRGIFISTYENLTEFRDFDLSSNIISSELSANIESLNYNVTGFYEYDDTLYFYSKSKIHKLKDKMDVIDLNEDILLCSFDQDKFVYYTEEGKLKCGGHSLEIFDISCIIYYKNNIYVSTYNNEFSIYDSSLDLISRNKKDTFLMSTIHRGNLYFLDTEDFLNVYDVEMNAFTCALKFDSVKNMISSDHLFLLGTFTVKLSDPTSQATFLDLKNIKFIQKYQDIYYILVKGKLYRVTFSDLSYKYISNNNKLLCMDKKGSKIFSVDTNGLLKYDNFAKNYDILKHHSNSTLRLLEYKNKEYSMLTNDNIIRFNTKTKTLSQECINRKIIYCDQRIKVYYNEFTVDKKIIKYEKGIIKDACVKGDMILFIDYFKGFFIYDLVNEEWLDLTTNYEEDKENYKKRHKSVKSSLFKTKYNSGYIWNNKIILSAEGKIVTLDLKPNIIEIYEVDEEIVCFTENSLEINKSILYCLTVGNSIWKLEE